MDMCLESRPWEIRFVPMQMDKMGTNPFRDFALLLRVLKVLKHESPALILGYSVKPNVYGSLAARMLEFP